MLVSRLNPTKYPWANPATWLVIPATANPDLVDPVFLGRLAALARAYNRKITLTSAGGARDTLTQMRLYRTLPRGQAARPGTSWHEFSLAADVADAWVRSMGNGATDTQTVFLKYGLYKPMAKGNNPAVVETWHLQPIETRNVTNRPTMAPMAVPLDTKTFQSLYNLAADGLYGPKTAQKAQNIYWGKVCA